MADNPSDFGNQTRSISRNSQHSGVHRVSDIEDAGSASRADTMTFQVYDTPPWYISFVFAFQLILANVDSTLAMAYITYSAICPGDDITLMAELVALGLITMGIASMLVNIIGIRLPLVQPPSFVFAVTITTTLATPYWSCPTNSVNNTTPVDIDNLTAGAAAQEPPWKSRVQALSGGLIVGSLVQVVLGASGLIGVLLKVTGPLTIVPAVTLLGISVIESFIPALEHQWGVGILTGGLILIFTLILGRFKIPFPACDKKNGCKTVRYPLFRLFPHLLAGSIAWLLSYILTLTGVLSAPPGTRGYLARTDSKLAILSETPWLILPYPGRWGLPTFSADMIVVMIVSVFCNFLESIASYYTIARVCGLPPPPRYAINRALAVEGAANVISGLLGCPYGTIGASSATGFISITGNASRMPRIIMSVLLVIFGIFGKFGAVLSMIPDPIIGGMSSFTLSIIIAIGISGVVHIDLKSSRNIIVLGITFFLGLVVPTWCKKEQTPINTGNDLADVILTVVLSNAVLVGAVSGFILDNIIPGTRSERGLLKFHDEASDIGDEDQYTEQERHVYDLPCGRVHELTEHTACCQYIPMCANFRHDIFTVKCTCTKHSSCNKPGNESGSEEEHPSTETNSRLYVNGDVMTSSTILSHLSSAVKSDISDSTFTHL